MRLMQQYRWADVEKPLVYVHGKTDVLHEADTVKRRWRVAKTDRHDCQKLVLDSSEVDLIINPRVAAGYD